MTCVAVFRTDDGAVFVCDKRVANETGVVSDDFDKLTLLGKGNLAVAVAGDIGPAQVWLRAAAKRRASDLSALLDEQVGGDYDTVVYDAVAHQLYLADGQGCVVPHASEPACIGSGAEFLRGFVAAVGSVDAETLQRAIEACATRDLSVSRESSVTCVPRVARASVKRSRARRSARRRA